MVETSSRRLAARMSASQEDDRGSSPRESICCPHCSEPFAGDRTIRARDFTVCPSCREIIRFDGDFQLMKLTQQDCFELFTKREIFVAMLRRRMHLLVEQLGVPNA